MWNLSLMEQQVERLKEQLIRHLQSQSSLNVEDAVAKEARVKQELETKLQELKRMLQYNNDRASMLLGDQGPLQGDAYDYWLRTNKFPKA